MDFLGKGLNEHESPSIPKLNTVGAFNESNCPCIKSLLFILSILVSLFTNSLLIYLFSYFSLVWSFSSKLICKPKSFISFYFYSAFSLFSYNFILVYCTSSLLFFNSALSLVNLSNFVFFLWVYWFELRLTWSC